MGDDNKMKHLLKQRIAVILLFIAPITGFCSDSYIVTSPPRETIEDGKKQYVPIAELLTKVTGQTFTYKHPGDWLSYTKNMKEDYYDVVLDGPHFISWRMEMLGHTPIVRFSGSLKFMLLVNKDNPAATLDEIGGHTICALAPPNMATLSIQDQFENPMRQPLIMEVTDFKSGLKAMLAGKCEAAILPVGVYKRMNKEGKVDASAKIIFRSTPIPQQGFSVSKRITPELSNQISDALMSEDGHAATAVVRKRFGGNKDLMGTSLEEYQGYFRYLRDFWGFDIPGSEIEPVVETEIEEPVAAEPGEKPAE
jgi:ABC-type phosphate/phosphonate transport system substrate-binding protein